VSRLDPLSNANKAKHLSGAVAAAVGGEQKSGLAGNSLTDTDRLHLPRWLIVTQEDTQLPPISSTTQQGASASWPSYEELLARQ